MGSGVVIKNGRFPVQNPLGTWPGWEIQPHYEALGDLWVEIVKNAMTNIGLVRLSPWEWPKVGCGAAK